MGRDEEEVEGAEVDVTEGAAVSEAGAASTVGSIEGDADMVV